MHRAALLTTHSVRRSPPVRAFTGYSMQDTKKLVGGYTVLFAACGIYYYIRMHVLEPKFLAREEERVREIKEERAAERAVERAAVAIQSPTPIHEDAPILPAVKVGVQPTEVASVFAELQRQGLIQPKAPTGAE